MSIPCRRRPLRRPRRTCCCGSSAAWARESESRIVAKCGEDLQPTQKLKANLANPTIRRFLIHYFEL